MTILHEERLSDSAYVETIIQGRTVRDGSAIRPAENHWHMVFVKQYGHTRALVVGPWARSGVVSWEEGAEILWIKFKTGVFIPQAPFSDLIDRETILPEAIGQSFRLKSSTWQFPSYENAETFIDRLAREDVLVRDPVVDTVLRGLPLELSPRTVRQHFLRATGLTQNHLYQVARAQRAAALLRQGVSIPDTVYEAGYFDQPHLTRALKQWIGHTPVQIRRMSTNST
ncbi:MAG: helix-turn-helix domain-containing protein [Chloroflexales bacterium]|nr:helix-turn-helix domain-containing protein [Chloroflexales bacterium]